MVPHAEPDVPFALRRLQAHLQGAADRRALDRRLLVRPPAGHFGAGPHLRHAKLPLLLRQHIPLGDTGTVLSRCGFVWIVEFCITEFQLRPCL